MYICPTCDSETATPTFENNRAYCASGHRVFSESPVKGFLGGLPWGIMAVGIAAADMRWILAVLFAAVGITLYKAWRLSRNTSLTRRLSKNFLSFGIGCLLPTGLLIYPGSKVVLAWLLALRKLLHM